VILSLINRCWGEHLVMLDDLLGDAALHSLTGSDRLARFRSESTRLFDAMSEQIKREAVGYLFNLEVIVEPADPDEGAAAESAER